VNEYLKGTDKFDFDAKRYLNSEPLSKKHQLTDPDSHHSRRPSYCLLKLNPTWKTIVFDFNRLSPFPTTSIQKSVTPFVGGKYFQGYLCCLNKTEETACPKTNSPWFMVTVNYLNELTNRLNVYGKLYTLLRNVNTFLDLFLVVQTRFETCNDRNNEKKTLKLHFLKLNHNQTL